MDARGWGEDYVQLARQMGKKPTTTYAIIRRAQENGGEVVRSRGGARPQRVLATPELTAAAIGVVEEHPEYTLDHINSELPYCCQIMPTLVGQRCPPCCTAN